VNQAWLPPVDLSPQVADARLHDIPLPRLSTKAVVWGPTLVTDLHLGGYVMFIGGDIAMTAMAIGLAMQFFAGSRAGNGVGALTGAPGRTLSRQMAAVGMPAAAGSCGRHDGGEDARLAAYNA
jgi:hypothetical protein